MTNHYYQRTRSMKASASSPRALPGFTLIELLVVIAIIGILSSVVLASLNTARNKGADASIKSNLAGTRAQAELFYDANSNKYDNGSAASDVCNTSALANGVKGIYTAVNAAAVGTNATMGTDVDAGSGAAGCNSSATAWAAQAPLKTGGYYCVDSTGVATTSTADLISAASDTAC